MPVKILLIFNLLFIVLFACSAVFGQTSLPTEPSNLNFEASENNQPAGWRLITSGVSGHTFTVSENNALKGKYTGLLEVRGDANQPDGIVQQTINAVNFRNKRIRYRAAVRVESKSNSPAVLWLRVDSEDEKTRERKTGFFDNMMNRPIQTDQWQYYEIIGDVASQAISINFGLLLSGAGKAYIDDASLEVIGIAEPQIIEPAKAMTGRELRNLIAFAKLYGYVRYFHPSDEAFATDWDKFAVSGVRQVKNAKNDKELVIQLDNIFKPVAPRLRISNTVIQNDKEVSVPAAIKVLYWKHNGYGFGMNRYAYNSERVSENMTGNKLPSNLPKTVREQITPGVYAELPVFLLADNAGTLPHLPRNTVPANQPTNVNYNVADRATRIADVIILWNIFQHFYPYFAETKVDWKRVLPPTLQDAATDRDEFEFTNTLKRSVAQLQDGHGVVQSPNPVGFPPISLSWVESKAVVTAVQKDSPAMVGDIVTAVGGVPIDVMIGEQEKLVSAATIQYKKYRALLEILSGSPNSLIQMDIMRDGQPLRIELKRELRRAVFKSQNPCKTAELEPGIFYVDLNQITDEDFIAVLPKLEKARGIIFDLRGYPRFKNPADFFSHMSQTKMTSARFMVPVNTEPNQMATVFPNKSNWEIEPKAPYLNCRKIFITDYRAISQAESWLGFVEGYKLGDILGEATAGTNGDINPLLLPGGYVVYWTNLKVEKHDGTPHHGIGIRPTIPAKPTLKGIKSGRDELLEKAIQSMKNYK